MLSVFNRIVWKSCINRNGSSIQGVSRVKMYKMYKRHGSTHPEW